jgi:hypothetical protein
VGKKLGGKKRKCEKDGEGYFQYESFERTIDPI